MLAEARGLFLAHGYAGTSMQQIADAASVTKAALYYHFRDKSELYGRVAEHEIDEVRRALVDALAEPGDLEARLRHVGTTLLGCIEGDFIRLVGEHDMLDAEPHQRVHEQLASLQHPLAACFPEPAANSPMTAEIAGALFFQVVSLMGTFNALSPTAVRMPADAESRAALVAALFTRGYGASAMDGSGET